MRNKKKEREIRVALLAAWTGISRVTYRTIMLEKAKRFLELKIPEADVKQISTISNSDLFRAWWTNMWDRADKEFEENIQVDIEFDVLWYRAPGEQQQVLICADEILDAYLSHREKITSSDWMQSSFNVIMKKLKIKTNGRKKVNPARLSGQRNKNI